MKKISIFWRILCAFISYIVMFGSISVVQILFLYGIDISSFALTWSIAWAIGYFIAATLCFHLKSKWSLAVIDCILVICVISITWWFMTTENICVSADFKRVTLQAVVAFLFSVLINNYDFEKVLSS